MVRMRKLYIDIETIPDNLESMPAVGDLEFYTPAEEVKVPGNYKTEKAIENWEINKRPILEQIADEKAVKQTQEKYEKAYKQWSRGALDECDSRIITIGFAVDDEPVSYMSLGLGAIFGELTLLKEFFEFIKDKLGSDLYKTKWIAFNAKFDFSILAAKALKYQLEDWDLIPWDFNKSYPEKKNVFDPMLKFPHKDYNKCHSQHDIAEFLKIEGSKTNMTGKDVLPYYLEGKHQLIAEYCAEDVEVLRKISKRLGV